MVNNNNYLNILFYKNKNNGILIEKKEINIHPWFITGYSDGDL